MIIGELKTKHIILLSILLLLLSYLLISCGLVNNSINFDKSNFQGENLNDSNSLDFGEDYFSGEGNFNKVSLFYQQDLTFINYSTSQEGIEIFNEIPGWNMTEFELNFTNLFASDTHLEFETRNDGSEAYSDSDIYYAMSFIIPNSCYIKSGSIFLQYWGSSTGLDQSEFSIRIYNSTTFSSHIIPDEPIDNSSDQTLFDLTSEPINQPARWYQSNFTSRLLDVGKTINNTFFLVFQSIEYPNLVGFRDDSYIYYANEYPDDQFNSIFYKKSGVSEWDEMIGKNGMFKIDFSPISYNPNPEKINLTVFSSSVDDLGYYRRDLFMPNQQERFLIPISSDWFGPIQYNVSFTGKFVYNTQSVSSFYSKINEDVLWNSTILINQFPENNYNQTARFYFPKYWNFDRLENSSSIHPDVYCFEGFLEILRCSNDYWTAFYYQSNQIVNTSIYKSQDQILWDDVGQIINSSDYINVTSTFINSNGKALIHVLTNSLDIAIEQGINTNWISFPIWRPFFNTSIIENNTIIKIKTMTYNGTIAGISINTLRVNLLVNQSRLEFLPVYNEYVWESEIIVEARLTSESKPIQGEMIQFNFYEKYANGLILFSQLNDTSDEDGIARVTYILPNVKSIDIDIIFEGNILYSVSFSSKNDIIVRSPLEQFFMDYFVIILSTIIALLGIFSRFMIQKAHINKNMKKWKQKTNKFLDILNIDLLLIIHKESSLVLIQKESGKQNVNANLISGFLQAVTNFKYEIKKSEKEQEKKESMMLDYYDYKILIKDGNYIRVALILNSEPSLSLQKTLPNFIDDFEARFGDDLQNFSGDLSDFDNSLDLIDKSFNFDLINPHKVNENPPSVKPKPYQQKIISIAKLLEKDTSYFFISNLTNYIISAMPKEPKEKVIANIYDLHINGIIKPIEIN